MVSKSSDRKEINAQKTEKNFIFIIYEIASSQQIILQ